MPHHASDPESGASVECRSPDEVFELLASGVRVDILQALGETPDEAVPFSDLFGRVEVADSGNFNYHLDKLLGSFVRVGDGDGYELTHAGRRIVGAIHAGTYTSEAAVDPIRVGWECQFCGDEIIAEYADERAWFRCVTCGDVAGFSFPPGSIDQYSREELPTAFARWWHQTAHRLLDGFCAVCAGRLDGKIVRLPGGTESDPKPSQAAFACRRCGATARVSGATLATFHPVVEGFFAEHGFDVSARHASQVWGEVDEWETRILSEDPIRLAIRFGHDGERVTAELDPDATVGSVRREPVGE